MGKKRKSDKKNVDVEAKGWVNRLNALFGWRSLLLGVCGILLIHLTVSLNRGYGFVVNNLLISNWKFIRENKSLSLEERYMSRLGFTYAFVDYIAKNTPETAVLLFPKKEYIRAKGSQEVREEMTHKVWLASFLYPRKVVFEDERGVNSLVEQADYVVVVNGEGYDLLEYEVPQKGEYAVLPVKWEDLPQNKN